MITPVSTIRLGLVICLCHCLGLAEVRAGGPLHEEMEAAGHAFKKLSRACRRADAMDLEACLIQAEGLRKHLAAAAAYVPPPPEHLSDSERETMIADFKARLVEVGKTCTELIAALRADDRASAVALVAKLKQQQEEGHDKYRAD